MERGGVRKTTDESAVLNLQKELNINRIFCKLLVQRGIDSFEKAEQFFRPKWEHIHDPFLMKDMDLAVKRLSLAIENQEKILIYGDYDVDGTTSVSLLFTWLHSFYKNIDYYIPDRYSEGYGISYKGIDYALETQVTLIIALDCGTSEIAKAEYASYRGVDLIICDHHNTDEKLPKVAALLNPKRRDCSYPYKELSACAVCFKFVQAYNQSQGKEIDEILPLLDLVALSLACDIVALTGENRVLAYFGLLKMSEKPRLGLKTLIHAAGREFPPTINDLVFGVGPLINAAGRMGDAKDAVKTLLADNEFAAQDYLRFLSARNEERKEAEHLVLQEAVAQMERNPDAEKLNACILYAPHWHKGVIGIAAAKIAERYHRPTLIFTLSGDKMVASGRSVKGFDLYQALKKCEDLTLNFGGHPFAAGVTIAPQKWEEFKARFESVVSKTVENQPLVPTQFIDAELNLSDLTPKFWAILKQFAPFGPSNMRPVFYTKNVKDAGSTKLSKDGKHISLAVKQTDSLPWFGMAFSQSEDYDSIKEGKLFDIAFVINEDTWQGKKRLRLEVRQIDCAD
jgi:single-stranded-DNA-specific exonuclease